MQSLVEFNKNIGCGNVHACDRFRRNNEPAHYAMRAGYRIQNTLLEQLRICKKERCIPTEKDEAGDLLSGRIACDVVIALNLFGATQDSRVGAPTIPQKFDDREHNCQADSWNSAKDCYA